MSVRILAVGDVCGTPGLEFLEKKLKKLAFAEEYLQDLEVTARKETKGIGFTIDAILHFTWKKEKAVSQDCYELYEGIEKIADKIQSVAKKEKEKTMGI